MQRSLSVGDRLVLSTGNESTDFLIEEVLGVGGSCIAYKVSYKENGEITHKGILKEFCPAFLEQGGNLVHKGTQVLVPDSLSARFSEELESFRTTYRIINAYLSENMSAANFHTVQLGIFSGNNTAYTLTSCDYGKSLDKINGIGLHSLLKLMLSVTRAVELYHNAGFLHLDIKPKNILVLDGVTDIVKLFDFDSLIPISSFRDRTVSAVAVPEDYYVPELCNCDIRNIGVHTDIFEIGAMLFSLISGRAPRPEDMKHDAVFDLEKPSLLVGTSPKFRYELERLFKKTVQISRHNRYKTTAELKNQLTILCELSDTKAAYLADLPKWKPSRNSIGRGDEIAEIKRRLDRDGYVFIKGVGGLGKSELAKMFAESFEREYHTVQFCRYDGSLKSVAASLSINGFDEAAFTDYERLVREKNRILHTSDAHTLIIVDNFNVTHDKFLRDFLPSSNNSFKVIFTTRCNMAANYYTDNMFELSTLSVEECRELFVAHAMIKDFDPYIDMLCEAVGYNTLVIVLLAEAVKRSGKSIEEIYSLINDQRLDDIKPEVFHEYDFSSEEEIEYNKINAHLNIIFDISSMGEDEKEILKNMSLVCPYGIGVNDFVSHCKSKNINSVLLRSLINHGWLRYDGRSKMTMHPIVSDLLASNKSVKKQESYYRLARGIADDCFTLDTCRLTELTEKLSAAHQLERRYKEEDEESSLFIKLTLGKLYADAYRPKKAREYFGLAAGVAYYLNDHSTLSHIYYRLGNLENDFGTHTAAVEHYKKAIENGMRDKKECAEWITEAMMGMGDCYSDESDYQRALECFERALDFAEYNGCEDYIFEIAQNLEKICRELGLTEKREKYKLLQAHHSEDDFMSEFDREILARISNSNESGDFKGSLEAYEHYLAQKREEYGEDSPLYKDLLKNRWMFYAINLDKETALRAISETFSFVSETYGSESMEMADQLGLIATVFPRMEEYDYSISCAERAIEICDKNGERNSLVALQARLALARIYMISGKLEEAKAAFSGMDLTAFSGVTTLSDIIGSAGFVLLELSEYDVVEKWCEEYLKFSEIQLLGKVQALVLLSMVREQKGFLDSAEECVNQVGELIDDIAAGSGKETWMIQYYRCVARIAYRRGNISAALSKINELFDIFGEQALKEFNFTYALAERALYYSINGQLDMAIRDYECYERILRENRIPEEGFLMVYSNMAFTYMKFSKHQKAKVYFDKILAVKPQVIEPESYYDALVCNNMGWYWLNNGDSELALSLLVKSAAAFERLGIISNDYITAVCNIGNAHVGNKEYLQAIDAYKKVIEAYNDDPHAYAQTNLLIAEAEYVNCLLYLERDIDALRYINSEQKRLSEIYGQYSVQRVDFYIRAATYLQHHGYNDAITYLKKAEDIIDEGNLKNESCYARLLNRTGVYYSDVKGRPDVALSYFEKAKAAFEESGNNGDDEYLVVLQNIDLMNSIISEQDNGGE